MTVICCMSAAGYFIPPMLIFPRKNTSVQFEKGAPPGTLIRVHPSGWVQTHLFFEWFHHFVKITNPTKDSPVLLVLDGHYTHTRNIQLIDFARENFVTIISLPPHTTHRLQPLDKTFMSSFKAHYIEEVRLFTLHNGRAPAPFDLTEIFGKAYLKCQQASLAIKGFQVR